VPPRPSHFEKKDARRSGAGRGTFIIQYWDTESVPSEIVRAVQTFRGHNPDFQHLLFNEVSAADFIEHHFTSRELSAFQACAVPAMQSDYLRVCALLIHGGIYADVDMQCLANLGSLVESVACAQFYLRPGTALPVPIDIVQNGFFIVRQPGHPLLRFVLEVATVNIEHRRFDSPWFASGPGIFSTLYGIKACGSPHAYREAVLKHPKPDARLKLLDIVLATGGTADVLAGVRFAPVESRRAFVKGKRMAYQKENRHWLHWEGSIYRW
jgi:hypothetical protein